MYRNKREGNNKGHNQFNGNNRIHNNNTNNNNRLQKSAKDNARSSVLVSFVSQPYTGRFNVIHTNN